MNLDYLKANPEIVLKEELDQWAILFDPQSGRAFGLNQVGVLVWKNLDGKHRLQDIVEKVYLKCENVSSDVERQVSDFLGQLASFGLASHF